MFEAHQDAGVSVCLMSAKEVAKLHRSRDVKRLRTDMHAIEREVGHPLSFVADTVAKLELLTDQELRMAIQAAKTVTAVPVGKSPEFAVFDENNGSIKKCRIWPRTVEDTHAPTRGTDGIEADYTRYQLLWKSAGAQHPPWMYLFERDPDDPVLEKKWKDVGGPRLEIDHMVAVYMPRQRMVFNGPANTVFEAVYDHGQMLHQRVVLINYYADTGEVLSIHTLDNLKPVETGELTYIEFSADRGFLLLTRAHPVSHCFETWAYDGAANLILKTSGKLLPRTRAAYWESPYYCQFLENPRFVAAWSTRDFENSSFAVEVWDLDSSQREASFQFEGLSGFLIPEIASAQGHS